MREASPSAPPSSASSSNSSSAHQGLVGRHPERSSTPLARRGATADRARLDRARDRSPRGNESHRARPASGPAAVRRAKVCRRSVGEALDRYGAFVLHGVTGSGKTEVYLRLVERVLANRRRALVLVPEIGLTPQLVGRFSNGSTCRWQCCIPALTDHERLLAWREAFSGPCQDRTRHALCGVRSRAGPGHHHRRRRTRLFIQTTRRRIPLFSARSCRRARAACRRPDLARLGYAGLGDAAQRRYGRYARLTLPRRADQAAPPRMALSTYGRTQSTQAYRHHAIQAMERHLNEDGQVLVFLNRRGYAPTCSAPACGWVAPCSECDARLTVHMSAGRLRCHHCGADGPLPARCPQCGFAVKPVGQGTERIEEAIAALFPGLPARQVGSRCGTEARRHGRSHATHGLR